MTYAPASLTGGSFGGCQGRDACGIQRVPAVAFTTNNGCYANPAEKRDYPCAD